MKFYKSPATVHDFPSAGEGRTLITCDRLCSTEAQPLPTAQLNFWYESDSSRDLPLPVLLKKYPGTPQHNPPKLVDYSR